MSCEALTWITNSIYSFVQCLDPHRDCVSSREFTKYLNELDELDKEDEKRCLALDRKLDEKFREGVEATRPVATSSKKRTVRPKRAFLAQA